jgi:hypothetical protein
MRQKEGKSLDSCRLCYQVKFGFKVLMDVREPIRTVGAHDTDEGCFQASLNPTKKKERFRCGPKVDEKTNGFLCSPSAFKHPGI